MRNKIIFFGTPYFAASLLEYLIKEGFSIIALVTQPDRPKGRSNTPSFSQVKKTAIERLSNIPIFQPGKASDSEFIQKLAILKPDLFIVVGYGQILKQFLLDIPLIASINVHASLLPKYRGAAPIQRCLMAGEVKTGITIMKMTAELDAGDILGISEISISEEMTFGELEKKLLESAKPLLKKILLQLEIGAISGQAQNNKEANYSRKLTPEEFQIAWDFPALQIHNLIRALSPRPGAWCWITISGEKKKLKILKTLVLPLKAEAPGHIVLHSEYQLVVNCKDKTVAILEVQLEGKKPMPISSFLRGVKGNIIFQ